MNKNKFLKLLQLPLDVQENTLGELEEMKTSYPYCQAIHILIAKGHHLLATNEFEKKLNHAAVYTADRKNLKELIENNSSLHSSLPSEQGLNPHLLTEEAKENVDEDHNMFVKNEIETYLATLRREKLALQFQSETGVSEDVIEERQNFIRDLDLKILEAEAKLALLNPKNAIEISEAAEEEVENAENEEEVGNAGNNELLYTELKQNLESLQAYREGEEDGNTGTGIIVENPDENKETKPKNDSESITTLSNNVEKERMEEYLASLKAVEEENISNQKLKEQIRIINNFIENEPKLSRLEREEDQSIKRVDLSLKSLKVDENMASENLALIMVKQGKLAKAEEIYNKLIWKFPEKKAYFVARIEDLKHK